jgi:antitoxin (DNA-binding transcriptional repressor) of toxin-antitoxin stability system
MKITDEISIKELHAHTGVYVRKAAKKTLQVTERGEPIAILASPHLLVKNRRKRVLLPEYKALMKKTSHDVLEDLDAVRER